MAIAARSLGPNQANDPGVENRGSRRRLTAADMDCPTSSG